MVRFTLFLLVVFSGCISSKKETYLQNASAEKYVELPVEYVLQTDDIISVRISSLTPSEYNFFSSDSDPDYRIDPLLSGFLIDKSGNIQLPVLGAVNVKGLTLQEAQEKVKLLANEYLDEPTAYIRLVNFKFTLLGEVRREGTYSIYDSEINILEAIGMAGGLTNFADRANLKLVRTTDNVTTIHPINILSDQTIISDFYYLKPNDVIIVKPLKTKNFRQNQAGNIGLFFAGLTTIATLIIALDRLK